MRDAALAREIRRALRDRVRRRPFRRSIQIFVVNLLRQRSPGVVFAGISALAAVMIISIGRMWDADVSSILMLNAMGSAASVFLIANAKWVLDREDFPRFDTLAVVPCTDRQWLIDFLRAWRTRLALAPGFTGITLVVAKQAMLPDRPEGWLLIATAFIAQLGIITALALCISNAAPLFAKFSRSARFYHFVLIALSVATVAMANKQFASAAIAFAYPHALAVLPTAWPAGILHLVDNGLPGTVAFALLGACITAAVVTGALAIWGLNRSFKIIEILQDPWGRGFVIRQSAWEYYSPRREDYVAVGDGQEFVNDDGETAAAAPSTTAEGDHPPAKPMVPETSRAEDESKGGGGERIGQRLEDFWKQQGWISGWFTPGEKDVPAFFSLALGIRETPAEYFRRCVRAMLLVTAVVVIGPWVLDAAARNLGQTLLVYGLGILAYYLVAQGRDVSSSFRALPLSMSQWLWPRLKFQWLRLVTVLPPGLLLLSVLLWNMGKPVEEISLWISTVVTFAFLLLPLVLVIGYYEGCRDRWYSLANIGFLIKALGALVLLATGMALLLMLPWPRSFGGLALTTAATWVIWRTFCAWYERGPVDAPVGS